MTLLGVSPEYCVFCACNSSVKKEIVSFSFDDDDDDDEEKEKEKEEELFCLYFATTIVSSWDTDCDKVMERYSLCVCVC